MRAFWNGRWHFFEVGVSHFKIGFGCLWFSLQDQNDPMFKTHLMTFQNLESAISPHSNRTTPTSTNGTPKAKVRKTPTSGGKAKKSPQQSEAAKARDEARKKMLEERKKQMKAKQMQNQDGNPKNGELFVQFWNNRRDVSGEHEEPTRRRRQIFLYTLHPQEVIDPWNLNADTFTYYMRYHR